MDQHLISYYIGILIVFGTHIYLLITDKIDLKIHSIINIVAGLMIVYYFLNKENIIKF